jgi:hypothetical protein
MSIEAMKQALEFIDSVKVHPSQIASRDALHDTLRTAIAQAAKQEPVAWFTEDHREDKSATTYSKKMAERWKEKGWPVTPLYTTPQPQEFVCSTGSCRFTLTQTGVGIGARKL